MEGEKIDCIEANPDVSFCVVGETRVLPEAFGTLYESAVVRGVAGEAEGDEKRRALEGLLEKYSPDHVAPGREYIKKLWDRTRVYRVTITSLTGKARRK